MTPPAERVRLESLVRAWHRFWFTPIPPHSYALLRLLVGFLGFLTLIGLRDLDAYWSLDGLVPDEDAGLRLKSWVRATGSGGWVPALLYLSTLLSLAAMTVGYRTGTAVTLSLVLSVLQVSWNNLPLSGAHSLMTGFLFCLIWADCGAVWSLDAYLERRRSEQTGDELTREYPIAPLRLVRFQIALLYLSAGLWKLANPTWRDGTALHYVLNNNVFARFPFSLPANWEPLLTIGTYVTLAWEIGFAFALLWRPTRRLVLIVGVLIHLGMIAGLEIGPFSLVMLAGYTAFLAPEWVASLASRIAARLRGRLVTRGPGKAERSPSVTTT